MSLIGQKVFHAKFGEGTIEKIDPVARRPEAFVRFAWGPYRCPLADLLDSNRKPLSAPEEIVPSAEVLGGLASHGMAATKEMEARRGLTALRLGQVLESQVLGLSVGTDELRARFQGVIEAARERRGPQLVLVEGPWGGGKTHALTLLTALAQKERFATAGVVLDGQGLTLGRPMLLLSAVLDSMRYPGEPLPEGVADRLSDVIRTGKIVDLRVAGARTIADALQALPLRAMDDPEVRHVLEDYLAGALPASGAKDKLAKLLKQKVYLPPVNARAVKERPERFVSLVGEWSRLVRVCGAQGLLVVLDELDVDYASDGYRGRAGSTAVDQRGGLFEALAAAWNDRVPLIVALGAVPGGGGETDAVGDVADVFGERLVQLEVPRPSRDHLLELFFKLVDLYDKAHPKTIDVSNRIGLNIVFNGLYRLYERQPSPVPRHLVRLTVELLDALSAGELDPTAAHKLLKTGEIEVDAV